MLEHHCVEHDRCGHPVRLVAALLGQHLADALRAACLAGQGCRGVKDDPLDFSVEIGDVHTEGPPHPRQDIGQREVVLFLQGECRPRQPVEHLLIDRMAIALMGNRLVAISGWALLRPQPQHAPVIAVKDDQRLQAVELADPADDLVPLRRGGNSRARNTPYIHHLLRSHRMSDHRHVWVQRQLRLPRVVPSQMRPEQLIEMAGRDQVLHLSVRCDSAHSHPAELGESALQYGRRITEARNCRGSPVGEAPATTTRASSCGATVDALPRTVETWSGWCEAGGRFAAWLLARWSRSLLAFTPAPQRSRCCWGQVSAQVRECSAAGR